MRPHERPDDHRPHGALPLRVGRRSRPGYRAYHDEEWGVPVRDERHLFELLILEGAQAGLSWSTILRKREGYRRAFAGFDVAAVAAFDDGGRGAAARRRRDRAQPAQGLGGDRQRPGDAARCTTPARRSWTTCGRSWTASRSSTPGRASARSRPRRTTSRAMSRDLPRARLPLRGPDDLLRADAVGRARERPRDRLLPLPRGGSARRDGPGPSGEARQASRSFIRLPGLEDRTRVHARADHEQDPDRRRASA